MIRLELRFTVQLSVCISMISVLPALAMAARRLPLPLSLQLVTYLVAALASLKPIMPKIISMIMEAIYACAHLPFSFMTLYSVFDHQEPGNGFRLANPSPHCLTLNNAI